MPRSTPFTPRTHGFHADNTQLKSLVDELRDALAEVRATVAKQDAHIHRLVKMTFGCRSERRVGPTLFDDVPTPDEPPAPTPAAASDIAVSPHRRRGHGRKKKPLDLPRQREEVDLTDAEKRCPCCAAPRVCIGTDVSERLD